MKTQNVIQIQDGEITKVYSYRDTINGRRKASKKFMTLGKDLIGVLKERGASDDGIEKMVTQCLSEGKMISDDGSCELFYVKGELSL